MVTLDTFMMGWRPTDLDAAYLPFLAGTGIANYLTDPAFNEPLAEEAPLGEKVFRWAAVFGNPRLTWDDLAWLRERTSLPIVLKGVLHPDDARAALDAGVDGLVVSNHGGRQVDGAVASLDALPAMVEAVAERCPCWSTPGCGPAPTSSRPWPSGRPPCSTGGPTSTGWGWAARRASSTCCAACSESWT